MEILEKYKVDTYVRNGLYSCLKIKKIKFGKRKTTILINDSYRFSLQKLPEIITKKEYNEYQELVSKIKVHKQENYSDNACYSANKQDFKVPHDTIKNSLKHAIRNSINYNNKYCVYKCGYCKKYHVGTQGNFLQSIKYRLQSFYNKLFRK
jgi:hypothetical protein